MTGDDGLLVRMALLLSPVVTSEEQMVEERARLTQEVRVGSRGCGFG